jgi:hypothetical protein
MTHTETLIVKREAHKQIEWGNRKIRCFLHRSKTHYVALTKDGWICKNAKQGQISTVDGPIAN